MIKKICNMVLALTMITMLFTEGVSASSITNPTQARDGVVLVYCAYYDEEGNLCESIGSGFAIGDPNEPIQYIVTNNHVVESAINSKSTYGVGNIKVYFSAAANKYMEAQVITRNQAKDFAVLKLPEPTTERTALVLADLTKTQVGDSITALGYPAVSTQGQEYIKYDKSDIVMTKGIISKESTNDGKNVFQVDAQINHGNSGGPLVNDKGEVVGINTFGYLNDLVYYAITIDEFILNVDARVIPFTVAGNDDNTLALVITIGCSAAALVIIVIVILLIVLSRKKKSNKEKPEKKEKKSEKGEAPKGIIGTNGQHAEKTYTAESELKIGRDPAKCNIVFTSDSAGVSGYHCSVYKKDEKLYIIDKGSSYGTFVNEVKLENDAEKELNVGDTIWLAGDVNAFKVI